jgi:ATP-dependent RNA helicase RhlE
VLAPTRELATQIHKSLKAYGLHLRLHHAEVVGGVNQAPQVAVLRRGVDTLVATPGRLLDLIGQEHIILDHVRTLIVDEADRMFDMGFIRDVRRIVSMLPRRRHSMLFSATMPPDVTRFITEFLRDPLRIDMSPPTLTADRIEQEVHFVEAKDKRVLLCGLLRAPAMKRVIVFTRTKHGANKLVRGLGDAGHSAEALHGNKSQSARQRALEAFRSGRARVLVATDIAARGIDIECVTHVVNFDLPEVAENYVHRIGRTARAGSGGTAISFCDSSERDALRLIERAIGRQLPIAARSRQPDPRSSANGHRAPRHGTKRRPRELQRREVAQI